MLRGILGLLFKLYIAIVFTVTLLIFYIPIVVLKSSDSTKKSTFKFFVAWSWSVRILSFIRVKFIQKSNVPIGPYIVVCNHTSYFDIFLMYSIIPNHPFLFLGKSEILFYPLVKSFFKNLNIPVDRSNRRKSAQSFIAAKKAIKNDWSLVIFPEGGIPNDNNPVMIPFKEGAFLLAKSLNVPIVPMTFTNNYLLFSDPGNVFGPARPGVSRAYIHPTIVAAEVSKMDVKALSDYVFKIVQQPFVLEAKQ